MEKKTGKFTRLLFHYNRFMNEQPVLRISERGLYCEAGDFYIDPWMPVERAVVTHAHSDHLVRNSRSYLFAQPGEALAALRLEGGLGGQHLQPLPYGETVRLNGVQVSLHPAGHILGSAQVRVEQGGQVWVVTGDYKLQPDPTCEPFELVGCHVLVTEATFGLPVYRWPETGQVIAEIEAWWRANQRKQKTSMLFAYSLGKAQRILASIDNSIGPIYTHGAVQRIDSAYRRSGVALPPASRATSMQGVQWDQALVVAPPAVKGTAWTRRFGAQSTGMASGWMRIRGNRRRRAFDRGFVLSDHADWPGLMQVVQASGAGQVWVTHGYTQIFAGWLREQGIEAQPLETPFDAERVEGEETNLGED